MLSIKKQIFIEKKSIFMCFIIKLRIVTSYVILIAIELKGLYHVIVEHWA